MQIANPWWNPKYDPKYDQLYYAILSLTEDIFSA